MGRNIRRGATVVALLLPVLTGGVPAGAEQAPTRGEECVVPDDSQLRYDSNDYLAHERWVAATGPQRAVRALGNKLASLFGEATKEDPFGPLGQGYIGSTLDHHRQAFVVVVDPSLVEVADLQRALDRVAARASEEPGVPRLNVDVIAGCFAAPDLQAAQAEVMNRRWDPEAANASFGLYLEPMDSRLHVDFDHRDWRAAFSLQRRLGDLVRISFGAPQRQAGARGDDVSPHYGGAGLHTTADNMIKTCTAGFSVILPGGGRGSVTADHCVQDGVNFGNADDDPFGVAQEVSGYPNYDMARILPEDGHTFTNRIWVDPCCPSTRTVTAAAEPVVNEFVCISGFKTKAKCGIKVVTLNASLCAADGCTTAVMRGEKLGSTLSATGDSGAPIYTQPTSTTAHIRAMHIGGDPGRIYAERWTAITLHLGVTIAKTAAP